MEERKNGVFVITDYGCSVLDDIFSTANLQGIQGAVRVTFVPPKVIFIIF